MKKYLIISILLIGISSFASKAKLNEFFNATDNFLKSHVSNGTVKYANIKKNPIILNRIVTQINHMNLNNTTQDEKMAFYINAYNIMVIKAVVNHYPIAKPLDVNGFFDEKKYLFASQSLTLNDIENKKIRVYKDARIHFALVCAARGCPAIVNYAYRPEKLESQLQERAVSSLNDLNFIRVKPNAETIYISEIFKWYESDFVTSKQSTIDYINKFRKAENKLPSRYKVTNYPYNWKLNEYK